MGDRANVVVKDDVDNKVFLYTHWHGFELPAMLQLALGRGERHDDPQYLARIIFCEMVRDSEGEFTGYGISARLHDNDRPLLVVDCGRQQVHEAAEIDPDTPTAGPWSFADYPGVWSENEEE